MTKLAVEVHDQTKEEFLRELLASLPYVSVLAVAPQRNGSMLEPDDLRAALLYAHHLIAGERVLDRVAA